MRDDFVANQCIQRLTSVAMDTSMLISGGLAIRQGQRLLKAASTTRGAEAVAKLGATVDEHVVQLASLTGKSSPAQEAVTRIANQQLRMGVGQVALGSLGVLDSTSNPLLRTVSDLRHLYFSGMLLKGTLGAPINLGYKSAFGVSTESKKRASILDAVGDTSKTLERVGQAMFVTGQAGLASELIRSINSTAREIQIPSAALSKRKTDVSKNSRIDAQGRADNISVLLEKFAETLNFSESKEAREILDGARNFLRPPDQGNAKGMGNSSDAFVKAKSQSRPPLIGAEPKVTNTDERTSLDQVDEPGAVKGAKPSDTIGETKSNGTYDSSHDAEKAAFVARLASVLLPDGKTISQRESKRCESLDYLSSELRTKPAFDQKDLDRMTVKDLTADQNKDLKLLAAATMLAISYNADGTRQTFGISTSGADAIYSRTSDVPGWSQIKTFPTMQPKVVEVKDRTIQQQLRESDLLDALVMNTLGEKSHSERRAHGRLLIHLGMPLETFGGMLKDIVSSKGASKAEKMQALVELSSTAELLKHIESVRESSMSPSELIGLKALAAGNSSSDLKKFFQDISSNAAVDRNVRLLSQKLVLESDKRTLGDKSAGRVELLASDSEVNFDGDKFLDQLVASSLSSNPVTLAECQSKFSSTAMLQNMLSKQMPEDTRTQVESRLKAGGSGANQLNREIASSLAKAGQMVESNANIGEKHQAMLLTKAAAARLLEPELGNGSTLTRLASLDQSADKRDRQSALEARLQLLTTLSSKAQSPMELGDKSAIIGMIPSFLKAPGELRHGRPLASRMESEFVNLMHGLLTDDLDSLASENRQAFYLCRFGYKSLWAEANSEQGVELRKSAIKALVSLGDKSAVGLLAQKLYLPQSRGREAESPDVRLVAAKAIKQLGPGMDSVRQLVQTAITSERDPAVYSVLINTDFDPIGLGEDPAETKYRLAAATFARSLESNKPSNDSIEEYIKSNSEFEWLDFSKLRSDIVKAKDEAVGLKHRVPLWPGQRPQKSHTELEWQRQSEVVDGFKQKFSDLCTTAFEDRGARGAMAREVIYHLITNKPEHRQPTKEEASKQFDAGLTNVNVVIDKKFADMIATMAAKGLAQMCRKHDGSSIPDAKARHLESLLHCALKHPEVSISSKLHLIDGIDAISSKEERLTSNGERIAAKNTGVILDVLETSLSAALPSNRKESEYELGLREELALKLLAYLDRHGYPRSELSKISGLTESTSRSVSPRIKQKAMELIQARDRVLTSRERVTPSRDLSEDMRVDLLEQALTLGEPAANSLGSFNYEKDLRIGLQARRLDEATRLVVQATKGKTGFGTLVDNKLVELCNDKLPQRLRLSAAVGLLEHSSSSAHRNVAFGTVANIIAYPGRDGYLHDAEELVKNVTSSKDLSLLLRELNHHRQIQMGEAIKSLAPDQIKKLNDNLILPIASSNDLSKQRANIASAFNSKHPGIEEALVNTLLTDKSAHSKLLPIYSNLALVETRLNAGSESRVHARAALSIALAEKVEIESQNNVPFSGDDVLKIGNTISRMHASNPQLFSVANMLENTAMALSIGEPNWQQSREFRSAANELRIAHLGLNHHETQSGLRTFVSEMNRSIDARLKDVVVGKQELELSQKTLQELSGKLETADDAQRQEMNNEKQFLTQQIKDATEKQEELMRSLSNDIDFTRHLQGMTVTSLPAKDDSRSIARAQLMLLEKRLAYLRN